MLHFRLVDVRVFLNVVNNDSIFLRWRHFGTVTPRAVGRSRVYRPLLAGIVFILRHAQRDSIDRDEIDGVDDA